MRSKEAEEEDIKSVFELFSLIQQQQKVHFTFSVWRHVLHWNEQVENVEQHIWSYRQLFCWWKLSYLSDKQFAQSNKNRKICASEW